MNKGSPQTQPKKITSSRRAVTTENLQRLNSENINNENENDETKKALEKHVHTYLLKLPKEERDQLSKGQLLASHMKCYEWISRLREQPGGLHFKNFFLTWL